jgi:hypothetical protein
MIAFEGWKPPERLVVTDGTIIDPVTAQRPGIYSLGVQRTIRGLGTITPAYHRQAGNQTTDRGKRTGI